MPVHIPAPTVITTAGHPPKRVVVGHGEQRRVAPERGGHDEPSRLARAGAAPEFDEYTVVLEGMLRVEHDGGALDVRAGEAVLTRAGERVRYSSPEAPGARYVAVCLPAFSPETVKRED